MTDIRYCFMETPIGRILLSGDDVHLTGIEFSKPHHDTLPIVDRRKAPACFEAAMDQVSQYFRGQLKAFSLPLNLAGTPFQIRVWQALQRIPYGETRSYRTLAEDIGKPKAFRAVGNANARNPIPIVIPCHRVINQNGRLGGFGGGLDVKQHLLELERRFG